MALLQNKPWAGDCDLCSIRWGVHVFDSIDTIPIRIVMSNLQTGFSVLTFDHFYSHHLAYGRQTLSGWVFRQDCASRNQVSDFSSLTLNE